MEPQKEEYPDYLPYIQNAQTSDDEIDLRKFFNVLWRGKLIVILTTILFAVGSVLYALSLSDVYKADSLLSPAESSGGGGLSKMAGQLGGLAALAGVNLGGGDSSQTDLAVQVIKSRQFISSFIDKHALLVPLMAAEGWDMSSNKLIIDSEIYDSDSDTWLRNEKGLRGPKPTLQEAYEIFVQEHLNIIQDKDSGLYKLSVKHFSPFIAQQWVTWLIEDINKVMRERTIQEATQNLSYLNLQLDKTAVAEMQSTFYKLIEEQTKSLMLAEVQDEFVFKVVDPALVPEIKEGPKRALICILGTFLGSILGALIVLCRFAFFTNERVVKGLD
ncbi:Wzz/FepE/Etk N-terminal domain-containing protein [Vibrio sp. Vb2354]|uniref:Wzz/FepE/Etk N-terminal domain-containing protein n=1 Tax=unclassified Vibrio TaxID=2614977 RepID=UPI0029642AC3|nr:MULTISPECIES: Wzz/FepE/Etk N-terminal domain-containing protein [unclassified Vibrio]MDW1737820.1 Wzz/FepE/Etk N-terminal domain-containing protein [Vibrio sp. Vb2321]MDW1756924.1 Wzz/FepE/Etk N-terminal domain-containing protein [Vibrio sp. Vb2353]MDW1771227.1 Wzz/FepE/Etk N-terminal domain-containing protein [Vibrio sp. Vb2354]MDW1807551.1 Wzz/FepE/Etk N-terminal domain-containing protein [Vibrio sp. Vb2362]